MKQQPIPLITATVCVGTALTRYTRGGTGAAVVVLSGDERSRSTLTTRLAHGFRVIAPELSAPTATAAETNGSAAEAPSVVQLSDFLDGLGIGRVAVVADEPFAALAIAFALIDPERAAAVVLVYTRSLNAGAAAGMVEGRLQLGAGAPSGLVAVWLDLDAGEHRIAERLESITEFLSSTLGDGAGRP